ncbi:hypothetical protein MSAN_00954300 [Mycena sanguinolenta]|uniref:Uncharacterized protein n=1 Tax=Mycena sanguinolenta TaxID=230812 RepID=A0A8H7DCW1_9AGAR|nr:hypothetical protein MSAN_00954300 [Mycena sanguinolenta]
MSLNPSPFLPPELEREIFENAALMYPETVNNLLLVSHRVREWIERIKYRIVAPKSLLSAMCRPRGLLRLIQFRSKPASFFRDRVQHLFVEGLDAERLDQVLSLCSGIQSLVLFRSLRHVPSLNATRPRQLALLLDDLYEDGRSPHMPMFAFVTHLDLFDTEYPNTTAGDVLAHLALMPALTHLSMWQGSMRPLALTEVLARCGRLKALIGQPEELVPDLLRFPNDVRFVSMLLSDEYVHEWAIGIQGGLDFWARADAFIAKRRRGEIKPRSRWIEDGDFI